MKQLIKLSPSTASIQTDPVPADVSYAQRCVAASQRRESYHSRLLRHETAVRKEDGARGTFICVWLVDFARPENFRVAQVTGGEASYNDFDRWATIGDEDYEWVSFQMTGKPQPGPHRRDTNKFLTIDKWLRLLAQGQPSSAQMYRAYGRQYVLLEYQATTPSGILIEELTPETSAYRETVNFWIDVETDLLMKAVLEATIRLNTVDEALPVRLEQVFAGYDHDMRFDPRVPFPELGDADRIHTRNAPLPQGSVTERKQWERHLERGVAAYQEGRYVDAEESLQTALKKIERSGGQDSLALTLTYLARLYEDQGRYVEAEPLYQRALVINQKAPGPEHLLVATSFGNLGVLYFRQGRYAEAEPLLKRSLAIREKALGPEHPDVAESLINVAQLNQVQGRYAEAESLLKRTLGILEKELGPAHLEIALCLNNLAEVYRGQDRLAEAEPLLKRSLSIREIALGPEHPDVAESLNNLGLLYQAQGSHAETEPLLNRSLRILERALGPEHPRVAVSLNNLADLYASQGRLAEAEPLFKRSIAIDEKVLGWEHPGLAIGLNNLAGLYHGQGRCAEAEQLYRRSLDVLEKALGSEHPDLALPLEKYAALLRERNQVAEATKLETRAKAIQAKHA